CSSNPIAPLPVTASRIRNSSTSAAPTSTTKMTGFFISVTGFSLMKASFSARFRMSGSKSDAARTRFFGIRPESSMGDGESGGTRGRVAVIVVMALTPERKRDHHREHLLLVHQEVLDDGSERKRREERPRADDDDGCDKEPHEQRPVCRKRPRG